MAGSFESCFGSYPFSLEPYSWVSGEPFSVHGTSATTCQGPHTWCWLCHSLMRCVLLLLCTSRKLTQQRCIPASLGSLCLFLLILSPADTPKHIEILKEYEPAKENSTRKNTGMFFLSKLAKVDVIPKSLSALLGTMYGKKPEFRQPSHWPIGQEAASCL